MTQQSAILLAALACTMATAFASTVEEPVLRIPVTGFIQSITREATLECVSSRLLYAPGFAGERVLIWVAPEGALVKKGDVVARFDPSPVEKNQEVVKEKQQEAADQMETFETDLSIRLDSEGIRIGQISSTLVDADRQKSASRFLPEIPRSIASVKRDILASQLQGGEKKFALLENAGERKKQSQMAMSRTILGSFPSESLDVDQAVVRANETGYVTHLPISLFGFPPRKVQTGDSLERRQAFLKIQHSLANRLQIGVSSEELPLVKHGQKVEFETRTAPGRKFLALISDTPGSALTVHSGSPRLFAMVATILPQPGMEDLRPGMTALASIQITSKTDCLAVPIDWVFHDKKNRVHCEMPDGSWKSPALPDGSTRVGDYMLLPVTFARADASGVLLLKPPPCGSAPAAPHAGDLPASR